MKYRAEIDGLRALAVLPVIFFHAGLEYFKGGFVGVDIFFVISGYLITTIIIKEIIEEKFSIVNFYERRARRLLPALYFVMGISIPFALLWLSPNDLKDFGQSLVAVSTFSSNILFWRESGYFDTISELKPFIHTWSIAVEEQFYILFPIYLLLTWKGGIKFVTFSLFIIFLSSIFLAQWGVKNSPVASYFLLPTRGWEILVGALIAIYLKYRKHFFPHYINQIFSLFGLSMIIFSIITFNDKTPFPSVYTLIPTIGAGLLILCSVPKTIAYNLLSLKLIVGIGLISYSTYLWHQPLLAFARHQNVLEELSNFAIIIICLLSFMMGWISWRFIEKPFRDKNVTTRKHILLLSFIGILVFSTIGITFHIKEGFSYNKYQKINNALANIGITDFEHNNKILQGQSWQTLRELSNKTKNSSANNLYFSNLESEKKKVLLVGNSHSKDLFNVLYRSNELKENFDIGRLGIQIENIDTKFYDSIFYRNSEIVILVSRFSNEDLILLEKISEQIIKDNKKLFIVEEIFNFPAGSGVTIADRVIGAAIELPNMSIDQLVSMVNIQYTKYFNEKISNNDFKKRFKKFNETKLIIQKKLPQVIFLSRMDYVCPENYCYGLDTHGNKNFYDYGHHTEDGAIFFGERLSETRFYEIFITEVYR